MNITLIGLFVLVAFGLLVAGTFFLLLCRVSKVFSFGLLLLVLLFISGAFVSYLTFRVPSRTATVDYGPAPHVQWSEEAFLHTVPPVPPNASLSPDSPTTAEAVVTAGEVASGEATQSPDVSPDQAVAEIADASHFATEVESALVVTEAAEASGGEDLGGENSAGETGTATADEDPAENDAASTAFAQASTPTTGLPAWVRERPTQVDGNPTEVITSDPFETHAECDADLDLRFQTLIQNHALNYCRRHDLSTQYVRHLSLSKLLSLPHERAYESIDTTVGPMRRAHLLFTFDEKFNSLIEQNINNAIVTGRLQSSAIVSGSLMIVLAGAFAALRWTNRSREKRNV